jgi:hypothetical protein
MMYVIPITIRNAVFKLTQLVSTWAMKMTTAMYLHGVNNMERQLQLQTGQRLEINFNNKTIAKHNFTGKQLRCILNNVEKRVREQIGDGVYTIISFITHILFTEHSLSSNCNAKHIFEGFAKLQIQFQCGTHSLHFFDLCRYDGLISDFL